MLASFMDELEKISAAANAVVAKPASLTFGAKPKSALKTEAKPTNYSMVNTVTRDTGFGTASQSKAVPAPPVRA